MHPQNTGAHRISKALMGLAEKVSAVSKQQMATQPTQTPSISHKHFITAPTKTPKAHAKFQMDNWKGNNRLHSNRGQHSDNGWHKATSQMKLVVYCAMVAKTTSLIGLELDAYFISTQNTTCNRGNGIMRRIKTYN